jgi:hypothetical protein
MLQLLAVVEEDHIVEVVVVQAVFAQTFLA